MKCQLAVLILILTGYCQLHAQNYATGTRTINFIDDTRSNRVVATTLHYPANTAGNNVSLATGTEKFPVVVFGHGFLIGTTAYQWLADSLVKQGFIVALPTTEGTISPSHEQFGRDLGFLAKRIVSLNDSAASFLFGRVLSRAAVGGHSMGGGASLLAMNYEPSIRTVFNMAAAETNPSSVSASAQIQKPALIIAGAADCVVRDTQQRRFYTQLPYPCKTFINIQHALHCHFANNDAICALGQISSGCNTSSVTAPVVFQKTMYLLIPFLQHYLKDDCAARSLFDSRYNDITGVIKERSCTGDPLSACNVTPVNDPAFDKTVRVYPIPAQGNVVSIFSASQVVRRLWIYDIQGRLYKTYQPNTNKFILPLPESESGVYQIRLLLQNGLLVNKKVIR
jgi:dienelactone hydrolase